MNLGAIFIGIAILVVAVPYVINPLVNEHKRKPVKAASLKKDGEDRQKDALAAIRDLDFDYQTEKVTREDYETLRAQLVLEAAEVLQTKQEEDEKIEAMIRARFQAVKPSVRCEKCGGEIRPQDHFCPTCGVPVHGQPGSKPASQIACPACGMSAQEGDLFCIFCGTRINAQPSSGNSPAES